MGQKYADTMALIVGDELMGKSKNDSEKAKELGVDKSVYSRCHAPVFDIVYDGVFVPVSKADDLAGRYWRECKLTWILIADNMQLPPQRWLRK